MRVVAVPTDQRPETLAPAKGITATPHQKGENPRGLVLPNRGIVARHPGTLRGVNHSRTAVGTDPAQIGVDKTPMRDGVVTDLQWKHAAMSNDQSTTTPSTLNCWNIRRTRGVLATQGL